MALRRGTIQRGRCVDCGDTAVIGLIEDPARWREAVWVCREHRETELERRRDAEAKRGYQAKQAAWYDERAQALAAIELFPPHEQARLHALASQSRFGRLTPEAPLYTMNLVRIYKARL